MMKNWKKLIVTAAAFGSLALFAGCTTASAVSLEEAKAIAYGHAGVKEVQARDKDVEWDDGRWEVSFDAGRTEYEYHISGDGKVLRWEKDQDD